MCTAVQYIAVGFQQNSVINQKFYGFFESNLVFYIKNDIRLRYANNLVIPQYQVDNTIPSMKLQNHFALHQTC